MRRSEETKAYRGELSWANSSHRGGRLSAKRSAARRRWDTPLPWGDCPVSSRQPKALPPALAFNLWAPCKDLGILSHELQQENIWRRMDQHSGSARRLYNRQK